MGVSMVVTMHMGCFINMIMYMPGFLDVAMYMEFFLVVIMYMDGFLIVIMHVLFFLHVTMHMAGFLAVTVYMEFFLVMTVCMGCFTIMAMYMRFSTMTSMAMQIFHIMVVIFVRMVQQNTKITAVNTSLLYPADFYGKAIRRYTVQNFQQHFPVRAQIQQRSHHHVSADPRIALQIQCFSHSLLSSPFLFSFSAKSPVSSPFTTGFRSCCRCGIPADPAPHK